jgi:NhaP-type Na+/H+ and K+/H+ antiporter
MFFNVLVFRFLGVFLIIGLSQLITRRSVGLTIRELIFISYAGQIRGAVVLGLVLRLYNDQSLDHASVIVTASYFLVIASTVIMGSTVSSLQRILFSG